MRASYLPALVMIISVPMSWKRFHRSAHCSSTWISSMEAGAGGSLHAARPGGPGTGARAPWGPGTGARSAGEPKEHEVLSARPSPSEPGLASESGVSALVPECRAGRTQVLERSRPRA
ncbi:hypothetical protein EYF80_054250 [Liparis tanakae]|uniref:Uncharacterized protein n=1 Tax=Liparis tanakae TaxID=230148 RepID=A0A4Z2F354_9TELE|nr:hypothetical protein EYF80_054250 [Liparis tanakae]